MPVRQPPEASVSERIPLRLRCNLRFAALVMVSLPLLITLGFWQLARAVEKEDALRLAETRRLASPVSIDRMNASEGRGLDDKRVRGVASTTHCFASHAQACRGRRGVSFSSLSDLGGSSFEHGACSRKGLCIA